MRRRHVEEQCSVLSLTSGADVGSNGLATPVVVGEALWGEESYIVTSRFF